MGAMAEIRKYDPAAGNAIAQALRAAMGDPVRPATPGKQPTPGASAPPPTTMSFVRLTVTNAPTQQEDDAD